MLAEHRLETLIIIILVTDVTLNYRILFSNAEIKSYIKSFVYWPVSLFITALYITCLLLQPNWIFEQILPQIN